MWAEQVSPLAHLQFSLVKLVKEHHYSHDLVACLLLDPLVLIMLRSGLEFLKWWHTFDLELLKWRHAFYWSHSFEIYHDYLRLTGLNFFPFWEEF